MIIDITEKMELEKLSIDELQALKQSVISVLQSRHDEVVEKQQQTAQERETKRIFENIKQNAISLANILKGTEFGWEIEQLLQQEKYAEVIEKIAAADFKERDRPYFDESRYSHENQVDVRALLIFQNLKDNIAVIYCDDLDGAPIDVADAFYHYDITHKDVLSVIREPTEETVRLYIDEAFGDQSLNIDLFYKLVMQAEKEGKVNPKKYTFIHAFNDTPLSPLPFQQERLVEYLDKNSPAKKLADIQDWFKVDIERFMAKKDQAVKDADYEKAASLREQIQGLMQQP